jgi:hypothetical protein
MGNAAMERIAKEQIVRVHSLVGSLPNPKIDLELRLWQSVRFVPVIVSLIVGKSKFCSGVPIVPILQMQDFLNQLPAFTVSMLCIDSNNNARQSSNQKRLFQ